MTRPDSWQRCHVSLLLIAVKVHNESYLDHFSASIGVFAGLILGFALGMIQLVVVAVFFRFNLRLLVRRLWLSQLALARLSRRGCLPWLADYRACSLSSVVNLYNLLVFQLETKLADYGIESGTSVTRST